MTILFSFVLLISSLSFAVNDGIAKEPDKDLWSALKPLSTTMVFLNTGAHPDDERSDFLAYLSRGLGVQTASLIANRGEGGQNEIGLELDNALGIIRSREMIEAADITGVKAYHLSTTTNDPIYDFGFSKSPEETLKKWNEDVVYERLIRFIRTYQPDIVMPSFRNVDTQHGHHRTMTILSEKAFKDAANPTVYPKHLKEGLSVWQVKKLYLPSDSSNTATTSIEIGDYDPIYQMSYPQLGEQSRYMHKSQGMGNDIPVAPRKAHLELVKTAVNTNGSNELFAGIPYNFTEWANALPKSSSSLKQPFINLQKELDGIIKAYPNKETVFSKSQKALKNIQNLKEKTKKTKMDSNLKNELLHKISVKEAQLQNVSFESSDLTVTISPSTNVLTRGQTTKVTVEMKNDGKNLLKKVKAEPVVPKGWKVKKRTQSVDLKPGKKATFTFEVSVPNKEEFFHAYKDPVIQSTVSYEHSGTKVQKQIEPDSTVAVLPDVGFTITPEDIAVNTANLQKSIPVNVKVKHYSSKKSNATVQLKVPKGWSISPKTANIAFSKQFEEKELKFNLTPPANLKEGAFQLDAVASINGNSFTDSVQEINYDHIGTFYNLYPAKANGTAFELQTDANLKIGYVDSGFDQVADYLNNIGLNITKLTTTDLESGNLNQYDTIVTGIRSYLSREDLLLHNARLMKYVDAGGHLVVQYHKPSDNWKPDTTAPFPLTIGNPSIKWRVTDEEAKVTVLQPESPLFSYPNKITSADWDNWIQERGLYFPMSWGPEYKTFVSMADPGEKPFDGGILMANYGKGTYLYTNLVFYRQIQGQVPGGYRIFTNLLSYKSQ